VPRVVIADGRRDRPVTRALEGEGTVISDDQPDPEGSWQGTDPSISWRIADLLDSSGSVPCHARGAKARREET